MNTKAKLLTLVAILGGNISVVSEAAELMPNDNIDAIMMQAKSPLFETQFARQYALDKDVVSAMTVKTDKSNRFGKNILADRSISSRPCTCVIDGCSKDAE